MSSIALFDHPERKPDEVFVCNTDEHGYREISYANKRRGTVALSRGNRGVELDQQKSLAQYRPFPVFAPKLEVEALRRALYGLNSVQLVIV